MTQIVEAVRHCRVYDASPRIEPGMAVFPGHPAATVVRARTHERDGYFLQTVTLGEHTGSHVDAPAHALEHRAAATIDSYPVDRFVAPYTTLDLAPLELGPGELASAGDIEAAATSAGGEPASGEAALLHYGWDRHRTAEGGWWAANTPGLDEGACALIASWGVGLVGSDTATCDTATRGGAIVADHGHRTYFLPNDILLVEGLQGLATAPGRGLLVAAPLRIVGGSGAPARVLLIAEASE